jgi:hypothetical protein
MWFIASQASDIRFNRNTTGDYLLLAVLEYLPKFDDSPVYLFTAGQMLTYDD